ncbi:sulfatase [Bacteroides sp.]
MKNRLPIRISTGAMIVLGVQVAEAQEKPNIILFLVDDMGWQDTSVPFWTERTVLNDTYRTPHMERLAAKGVKFTQAYACPVSSPSRVSLLTGANVAQHQVSNWTLYKDKGTDKPHKLLTFGEWNYNGLSPVQDYPHAFYAKCLPLLLKENGYRSCIIGKAHLGAIDAPAADPLTIGFDYNIGGHAAGAMGSYLGENNYGNKEAGTWTKPWGVPSLEAYHGSDIFLTEALTREGCKFMEKSVADKQPFFLYMSHYAVHAPFVADKRFYQYYIDKGLSEKEAQYASLVEGMDHSLGALMDCLERAGVAENTIILFMSDNGGYSVGRGGEAAQRNYPLRGGKGACFEGGIREPMIAYWPGITRPGTENATPVIIEDFFPTILEMGGVKEYQTPQRIDGVSFVKALKKGKTLTKERPLYFHYPNNWGEQREDVGLPQSAIRKGDWKLIHYYETGINELYKLKEDISEKNNLIKDKRYAKKGASLAKELSNYLKKNKANLPYFKETGLSVPYPDGTIN